MTALGPESVLSTRSLSNASIGDGSTSMYGRNAHHPSRRAPALHHTWAHSSEESEDEDMLDVRRGTAVMENDTVEPPDSVANSLLFELPREIRDRIYALALFARDGMPVEWPSTSQKYHIQASLLRTCKIIYNETAPLLYSLNCMTFHHPSDANMFVRAMSSRIHAKQITNLSLHIKALDARLWMPYLTSADETRSLKADFPNLRHLGVRFRSSRWQHHHPPETNLRNWCDDSRLDELIDGLRHVYYPSSVSDAEFESAVTTNPRLYVSAGPNVPLIRQMIAQHRVGLGHNIGPPEPPTIRICCACRVNDVHFNAITTPTVLGHELANASSTSSTTPPVREGDAFRGFTAVDLQSGVQNLHDPDLGSATVARTPYANKNGVLVALELHCLDPRKDAGERVA